MPASTRNHLYIHVSLHFGSLFCLVNLPNTVPLYYFKSITLYKYLLITAKTSPLKTHIPFNFFSEYLGTFQILLLYTHFRSILSSSRSLSHTHTHTRSEFLMKLDQCRNGLGRISIFLILAPTIYEHDISLFRSSIMSSERFIFFSQRY